MHNNLLHEWLIDRYGGYQFDGMTTKDGKCTINVGSKYNKISVEVDNTTTPEMFLNEINRMELGRLERELKSLPTQERNLKERIADLKDRISEFENLTKAP